MPRAIVQTSEEKYLASAMAQKDSVETASVTLLVDTTCRCTFPGPSASRKQDSLHAASKRSPFGVWSRLSIKRPRERSYDCANVKTINAYSQTVLKRLCSHRRTIVETEQNVNFLLAATVLWLLPVEIDSRILDH